MDVFVRDKGFYSFGPFRLDPGRRVLTRDGEPLALPARAFDTLLYLVENPDRPISKDELLDTVWAGRIVEESNVSQAIFTLRKTLESGSDDQRFITTISGRGYRFDAPVRLQAWERTEEMASSAAISDAEETHRAESAAPLQAQNTRWRIWAAGGGAMAAALMAGLFLIRLPTTPVPPAFDPPAHSVAVLALTNMSGDQTQDYFGDGLAEELINALGRVPAVHVAARVSTFSFKGKQATISEIAQRLNVGTVLEGSVRRSGDMLRISVQLIDARTGFQVWSRSYNRDEHDLLAVESDIATAVATSLQISLVEGEATRLTLGGTTNPAAFDAYLHGMLLLRSNDDHAIARARDAFDTAIRLDPSYARAYAGRAYTLCDIGMNPPPNFTAAMIADIFNEALTAADKAIALAPDLASAHAARGEILDNGFVKTGDAAAEVVRARDLEPGNAAIVGAYAQVENDLGHFDEAITAARLATTLDPLRPDVWYVLGYVLNSARSFDESLVVLRHEEGLRGGKLPEHSIELMARDQLMLGRFVDAEQSCRSASESYIDVCLALADHALGKTEDAQAHLAAMLKAGDSAPFNLVEVYAQWGDTQDALTWLETAFRTHDPTLTQIRSDPMLDPIRRELRFQAVERGLNLPP
jgi:serine/threonine-protein kinase